MLFRSAAGVEPVSDLVAAGSIERCGAGVAGEVVGVGESSDVADVAEDFGGQEDSQAVDVGESAAGRGQGVSGLGLVGFEVFIDAAQVAQQVTGQIPATCLGRGAGTNGAQQRGRLVSGQALGAPPGMRSRSNTCSRLSRRARSWAKSSRRSDSSRKMVV